MTMTRRPAIALVAYPVLATLTVLAAHLAHGALAWRGSPQRWHAVEPWVPSLVPAQAAYTVAPWPASIWASLSVALVLAFAAVSVLVLGGIRVPTWWGRTLALWAGGAIAALGIAGMGEIGGWWLTVSQFGGLGGSHLRTFTVPVLLDALRWGLVWGWAPALVTALLHPARSPEGGRRARIVVGIALLVGAVISGGLLAGSTYAASLSAQTEVAQPEEPESAGPSDPPDAVAATAQTPFPERCDADDIVLSVGEVGAATGARYLAFTAQNAGTEPCVLRGPPDLAFADEGGEAVRPAIAEDDATMDGAPLAPGDAELAPGESARADLSWRAPTGRPAEHTLLLAPWPGEARESFDRTLDVVDGVEMELTRWYTTGE